MIMIHLTQFHQSFLYSHSKLVGIMQREKLSFHCAVDVLAFETGLITSIL